MYAIPAFIQDLEKLTAVWAPDVLETMFFATAIPVERAETEQPSFEVRVGFRGSPSGVFFLIISARVATALAAGFLGMDDADVGPMEASQVACEMANMVCGSVLSRAESDTGFELSSPVLVEPEPDAGEEREWRAYFEVDLGDAIQVRFRVDETAMVAV
jgi:CheY-specific phosphatase CheX